MMAIIEEAAVSWSGSAEACGLCEAAIGAWRAGTGVAAQSQTRQQSIEQAVALMRDGCRLADDASRARSCMSGDQL
jgi:hypothetical protein